MVAKLTAQHYHELAKMRGLEWVGMTLPTTTEHTLWRCPLGHEFNTSFNSIRRHGCPHCSRKARKSPDDYAALAIRFGLVWHEDYPQNSISLTTWTCSQGHTFKVPYQRLDRNKGCPKCHLIARDERKPHPPEKYHELAKKRGYVWIGDYPGDSMINTMWLCPEGHEYMSCYQNLASGRGCSKCSRVRQSVRQRKPAEDYVSLAKAAGYELVGDPAKTTHKKTEWRCPKGHLFKASYVRIRAGHLCPSCHDMVNGQHVSKPQRAIYTLIGGELNYRVKRYYIDIALEPTTLFRIAVEYDCWHWHKDRVEHDTKRDQYLLSQGWRILRIKSRDLIPTIHELHAAIERLRAGETCLEIILPDWGE